MFIIMVIAQDLDTKFFHKQSVSTQLTTIWNLLLRFTNTTETFYKRSTTRLSPNQQKLGQILQLVKFLWAGVGGCCLSVFWKYTKDLAHLLFLFAKDFLSCAIKVVLIHLLFQNSPKVFNGSSLGPFGGFRFWRHRTLFYSPSNWTLPERNDMVPNQA